MGDSKSLKTSNLSGFPRPNGVIGAAYLEKLSDYVLNHRHEKHDLKSPAGATLTIGPLEDTEYKDKPSEVHGCSKFYLPTTGQMVVIGYVEGTQYPCDQLILMIHENGKLYGYDGDELHEVASSLMHLDKAGLDYPASKSYYYSEAFKDVTMEFWDKVRTSPRVKKAEEEHRELVASRKSKVAELIEKSKAKQRLRKQRSAVSQSCHKLPTSLSQAPQPISSPS
ncbi:uncharacterized protein LOC106524769 [Austrofundulus limnaeus]|uniref:Uncharacterized protein LOC106524769 n=1 Tax=Austrofundulus limnaeus TaxID=52670 RepID=A0A2I4C2F5_AUSLI|nr:PREDICTED: uncharacterized protein LOC106524769 [Austrofundulus limnaeus]